MIFEKKRNSVALFTTAATVIAGVLFIYSKREKDDTSLKLEASLSGEPVSAKRNENQISKEQKNLRTAKLEDDFSWVKIPEATETSEDEFQRTWTVEEYEDFSKQQPNAPSNWWVGIVGSAWKDQSTVIPKTQSIRIIQELEKVSPETPLSGEKIIIENDGIRNNIRMYRSFDKVVDSNLLECKQHEIFWVEEEKFFLLYKGPKNWSSLKKGLAIRKDDGAIFKWELD